ncbi:MAG TPA: EAL domain-containing protein [Rhodocyclaceae bacterium]|nr:EAL domain-containing protein [Rhodocyclaceae bacterium]
MSDKIALLLVDDRPENLTALEAVLGNQGIDLVMASSGNDALRHTLKQDFALVLLDVQMPGMDGFETAELMRANPKTRHLPIIFVTAGMKEIQLQFKGYELGAVDYLMKPFEPLILQGKVKVFCELYRQRRLIEANQQQLEAKIKERVAQLRESEERFRLLATHAPVGIYQLDSRGECLFVNQRWCEIAGLSAEQAAGPGWTATQHPEDRVRIAEALASGREWTMDYRFLRPDGTLAWVNGSAVALRDENGEITGYLGNDLDITVRKRSEKWARRRSQAMDLLAQGAPLTEILAAIATAVEQQADGLACAILAVDESDGRLVCAAAPNLSGPGSGIAIGGAAACARAARCGESAYIADIAGQPGCAECPARAPLRGQRSCRSEPIRSISGEVLGVFAFYQPMTTAAAADEAQLMHEAAQLAGLAIERKRTENELQIAASVYRGIGEAIMVTDADNRIIAVNPAFTRLTGYSPLEAIGQSPGLLQSGRHERTYYEDMWQSLARTGRWQGEIWNRRKNGEEYPEWLSINTLDDGQGKVLRRISLFSDITEQKRAEETIWRQANYDHLTDLPNRRLFQDRLQQEIMKAQRAGLFLALLFIDLDRFKEVNDTLGHQAGDLLLIQAAHRIGECVRTTDTVARLGGDEFTVIMSELADTDRVGEVAQSMLVALATPFELNGELAYVSASIGITIYPNDAEDLESLLKNADQAMYSAKEQGRNSFSYFTGSMQATAQKRLQLSNDLHGALAANQLEVYFQPIVDLSSGRIVKAEALLRWNHPLFGMVHPSQFIPIAEDTGLISELGDWVFRESAQMVKRWHGSGALGAAGTGLVQISVNKSPRQFLTGNTHETWVAYLKEIGLPARCINIEITEGLLLDDRPEVANKLTLFGDAGMRISLDDFGTGYSAMSYLKKFRIDYLKIDQSFVRDLAADPGDKAIAEAIIVMAHKLGIKVIAEGVETAEQRAILIAAGCDFGQGFLFSRPCTAADFEALWSQGPLPKDRA